MILTEIRTEAEYEFLKIWYSCEWITWNKRPESIFMIRDGKVLFEQDWKNKLLWCNYLKLWSVLETKFGYNDLQIQELITNVLQELLRKGTLTPYYEKIWRHWTLEEHLKETNV